MTAVAETERPSTPTAERAGSRWLYHTPSEDQVREWFNTQRLHSGMEHGPYMGGIVIISATEKFKATKRKANGDPYVVEAERAVFTPYVKVDTRIAYFWDYVAVLNEHSERTHVGVIEPVAQRIIGDEKSAYFNAHLPEGYFVYPVRNGQGDSVNRYIGARWRVAIYERESYARVLNGSKDQPVLQGVGTKQTPMAKNYADDNAIMKAETGAIGRALGVAGVLVVGTGVATAEDMQEASGGNMGAQGAGPSEPPPPDVIGPDDPGHRMEGPQVETGQVMPPAVERPESPQEQDEALRARARQLIGELEAEDPTRHAAYVQWYTRERHFPNISELTGPALSGAVVKLERTLDEARHEKQAG